MGLTGAEYEYNRDGGVYRSSGIDVLGVAGDVVGSSARFNSLGTNLGSDTWFFDGANMQRIGLSGGIHEAIYSGAGGGIRRANRIEAVNDAGYIAGSGVRYLTSSSTAGRDVWVFDGTMTRRIGIYPDDPMQGQPTANSNNWVEGLNSSGHVVGGNHRRSASGAFLGLDAWIYDGASTKAFGLLGEGYEYQSTDGLYRYGQVRQFNEVGFAVGSAERFTETGVHAGEDAWFYDGSAARFIGLTGEQYEIPNPLEPGADVFRESQPLIMNAVGQTVGLSTWFENGTPAGQTPWFFDPQENITVPIIAEIDGEPVMTDPIRVTDQGVVFGAYSLNGSPNYTIAFWWSSQAGFHDVGELVMSDDSRYRLTTSWYDLFAPFAGLDEGGSPRLIAGAYPVYEAYPNSYLLAASVPPGDADLDGDVDLSDLGALATNYGAASGRLWTQGDFDGDGDVDLSDLGTLATNYGAGEAQALIDFAQITSVPEPAGLLLAIAWSIAPRRPRDRRTARAAC